VPRLAPLPHHRGTPARRALFPGMPIPRLDPEAGLAWGCSVGEERVRNCQKLPVIVKCPENRLPPWRGISGPLAGISPGGDVAAGPRLSGPPAGGGETLFPLHMERSAVSPAPWRKAGPAGAPSPSRHPWRDDAGHPPAATMNVRDLFGVAGEGSRRDPTPGPQPSIA